ncbi:BppU family phage baseplate upper protein [Bacillus cereus]
MRNEVIVIDLADPICTKTIRSRQNDKNGLKLTVHLKENGEIVVLNRYAVKYEAINQRGQFIRDDAKIVDADKGIFEYILSPEAVSTPAEWLAYFVIEKSNTERTSTPDIRIVLRRDVKEGNIKIENYISDFETLKKTIDELQRKLNTMDVVKKSGDIITGLLRFNPLGQMLITQPDSATGPSARGLHYADKDTDGNVNRGGIGRFKGAKNGEEYLYMGFGATPWDSQSGLIFRPDGSATLKGKKIATADNDTGWIQMSINTANASNVEGRQVTRAKRNGDQVSVIGSLKNIKEGQVVFNIPTGLRPAQQITDVVIIAGPPYSICEFNIETGGNVRIYNITTDKIIHFSINYLV